MGLSSTSITGADEEECAEEAEPAEAVAEAEEDALPARIAALSEVKMMM